MTNIWSSQVNEIFSLINLKKLQFDLLGFYYVPNFVTEAEAEELINSLGNRWTQLTNRRVLVYGGHGEFELIYRFSFFFIYHSSNYISGQRNNRNKKGTTVSNMHICIDMCI